LDDLGMCIPIVHRGPVDLAVKRIEGDAGRVVLEGVVDDGVRVRAIEVRAPDIRTVGARRPLPDEVDAAPRAVHRNVVDVAGDHVLFLAARVTNAPDARSPGDAAGSVINRLSHDIEGDIRENPLWLVDHVAATAIQVSPEDLAFGDPSHDPENAPGLG